MPFHDAYVCITNGSVKSGSGSKSLFTLENASSPSSFYEHQHLHCRSINGQSNHNPVTLGLVSNQTSDAIYYLLMNRFGPGQCNVYKRIYFMALANVPILYKITYNLYT